MVDRRADPCLVGDIGKRAVAVVSVQMVLRHAGDINILPAIVVEIADGDSHVVAIALESGLLRDVCEGAVVVVVEQAVVVFGRVFFEGWNRSPVNQEDVRVSVVVIIDQTNARDHRFRLVFIRSRATVRKEVHTGASRDIFETDAAGVVWLNPSCDRYGKSRERCCRKDDPKHCRRRV